MRVAEPGDNGTRQAGLLFVVAGGIGLVNTFVPGMVGYGNDALRLIDLAGMLVGAVVWMLPWGRWRPSASATLVAPAAALIGASHVVDGVPPTLYGVWFIVVFAWVGMWHPIGTSFRLAPLLAVGFALPFAFDPHAPAGAVASVAVVIPAGVVLGEALARTHHAMRAARAAQEEAVALLAKASITDDLTGIGNRRQANRLLDELAPGDAVILIDLDHFKDVNDSHGHAIGDGVLVALAGYLQTSVGTGGAVARYGGEEFLVVLPCIGERAAAVAADLLCGWRDRSPLTTFSAGVATHVGGTAPTATLQSADRALYAAKAAGRACVLAQVTGAPRQ